MSSFCRRHETVLATWHVEDDAPVFHVRFYAHKRVLAAGSLAFARHFQAPAQVALPCRLFDRLLADKAQRALYPAHELSLNEIHTTAERITLAVFEYLYGMPVFANHDASAEDWADLHKAANGFEIPRLSKLALDNLERSLRSLLRYVNGEAVPEFHNLDVWRFVKAVQHIHKGSGREDLDEMAAAHRLAVVICCEHYSALRKHRSFNQLTELHPRFVRSVLDFLAETEQARIH